MATWKVQSIFPIWSCLLFLCVSCAKKRVVYTGYEAHRFTPSTLDQVKTLKNLEKDNRGLIFMRQVGDVGHPVDILFAPHLQTDVLEGLKQEMSSKLMSHDIEKLMDHDNNVRTLEAMGENVFLFDTYWDLSTYRSFLQNMESTHSDICKIERYGTSSGPAQLPLEAMIVSTTLNQPSIKKPTLFVDGGTHSREWITMMSCSHFLNDVVTNQQKYTAIMEDFNFMFVCCANPEGFAYSWDVNRLWRKTRTPTSHPACPGVDPNRNYAFGYGGEGTSTDQCSDIYKGEGPFTISETKNLRDHALTKDVRSYTSLHSYSQFILLGYGCQTPNVPNIYPTFQSDKTMATAAAEALKNVNGTQYVADNSILILYQACGTSQDWYLANVADYAWTYELRDTGTFGFVLPANQIKPCCVETTASLALLHQMMAQEIVDRKMARKDNGQLTEKEN